MHSFVLVLLAAVFSVVPASPQAKEVYVHGEGARSCSDYLRHRSQGSSNQDYFYATWIRGFLAGYSVATPHDPAPPKIPGAGELLAQLDGYCRQNPRHRVADAGIALAAQLGAMHR